MTNLPIKPLALTIPDTEAVTGIKKSTIYKYFKCGKLTKGKLDGRTVVTMESIEKLIADAVEEGAR